MRKILNNKYFRWTHLVIEALYFILVLLYLYFLLDIETNDFLALLIIMMIILVACLFIYILNVIDHWNDLK